MPLYTVRGPKEVLFLEEPRMQRSGPAPRLYPRPISNSAIARSSTTLTRSLTRRSIISWTGSSPPDTWALFAGLPGFFAGFPARLMSPISAIGACSLQILLVFLNAWCIEAALPEPVTEPNLGLNSREERRIVGNVLVQGFPELVL